MQIQTTLKLITSSYTSSPILFPGPCPNRFAWRGWRRPPSTRYGVNCYSRSFSVITQRFTSKGLARHRVCNAKVSPSTVPPLTIGNWNNNQAGDEINYRLFPTPFLSSIVDNFISKYILSCLSTMNKIRSHETYIRIIPCLNHYYSNKIYHSTKIFLFHFHQYSGQDNIASSLNYILVVSFRIKNQWIQNLQNQQNRTKLYLYNIFSRKIDSIDSMKNFNRLELSPIN